MAKKPTPKKKEKTLEELEREMEIYLGRCRKLSESIKKNLKGNNNIRMN